MRGLRGLRRGLAVLLVPIASVCLAFPALRLFVQEENGLIDDTRAWFGAGTAEGVPEVSQVNCFSRRYGSSSSSSRGVGMSEWSCTLYLTPRAAAEPDPFATLPYEEAMREYNRRLAARMKSLLSDHPMSGKIERVLPTNRTGDLPGLRRLSAEGEPIRFGVVWSGWEIAGRWLHWTFLAALFIGIGIACLYAARALWRRSG